MTDEWHCKPKLHYLTHIADCIDKFKTVMSCFSGESLHRLGKAIMRSAYKYATDTTLFGQHPHDAGGRAGYEVMHGSIP